MQIEKRILFSFFVVPTIITFSGFSKANTTHAVCSETFSSSEPGTSSTALTFDQFVTDAISAESPRLLELLLSRASKRWKSSKDWQLVAQKLLECPDIAYKACLVNLNAELEKFDISMIVDQSEDTMAISVTSIRLKVLDKESGREIPLAYNSETKTTESQQSIGLNQNFMHLISVIAETAFQLSQKRPNIQNIIFAGELVLNDRLIQMFKEFGFKTLDKKWYTEISLRPKP